MISLLKQYGTGSLWNGLDSPIDLHLGHELLTIIGDKQTTTLQLCAKHVASFSDFYEI
jgi:hypothetical protein